MCVLGPEQFVRTHSEYSMVDVIIIVALLADPRCNLEPSDFGIFIDVF